MARRQTAGRLRVLVDLGLPRRGRHPGVVRHLRPGPSDVRRPGAGTGAERLGGRGRRRRSRTHQGRRVSDAHLLHGLLGGGQRSPPTTPRRRSTIHRISGFVLPQGPDHRAVVAGVSTSTPFRSASTSSAARSTASARLVHGLLDVVVDGHFDAVQALDDGIESLEDDLFENNSPRGGLQRKTFRMRKDLVELRRVVLPMREVVNSIQHRRLDAEDLAGARPAVRRPLRPCAAGIGVDGIVAGHDHHGVRDEPVAAGRAVEHGDEEAHRLGGDHRGADGDHRVLRAERGRIPASRPSAASSRARPSSFCLVLALYWMFKRRDWL